MRYSFDEDDKLRLGFSPFHSNTVLVLPYTLKGDIIEFNTRRLKLVYYSDSLLIVEEDFVSNDIANQPKREYFYEKGYLINKYKLASDGQVAIMNDTINLEHSSGKISVHSGPILNRIDNYKPFPKFKSQDSHFDVFLQQNLPSKIDLNKGKYATVSFVVNSNDLVEDVNVIEGSNNELNAALVRVLEHPDNKWLAAEHEGKKIRTKMTIPFKMVDKADHQKLIIKAIDLVEKGNRSFEKKDFIKAIEFYNKSLELNPHNFNAVFNRSLAYYELKDMISACEGWNKIYKMGKNDAYTFMVKYCQ